MGGRLDPGRCRDCAAAAVQLRLPGRLVGHFSQPLRRTAIEAACAVVRRSSVRGEAIITAAGLEVARSTRCPVRCATRSPHMARPRCASHLRPDLKDIESRLGVAARQAVDLDLPAQGAQPLASGDRTAAGSNGRKALDLDGGRARPADQRAAGSPHRRRAARARDLDRGRRRIRHDRCALHAARSPRRIRCGRDARLGSADRRLSAAGLLCDRCGRRARRAGVARMIPQDALARRF